MSDTIWTTTPIGNARKPMIPNRIAGGEDLKDRFALDCARPSAID